MAEKKAVVLDKVRHTYSASRAEKIYSQDRKRIALKLCTSRKDGNACGCCSSCLMLLGEVTQRDGLRDAWKTKDNRTIDETDVFYAYMYDVPTPPAADPTQPGFPFVAGTSQVIVFTDDPDARTITIFTPASLAAITSMVLSSTSTALYAAKGTGVSADSAVAPRNFAISGIRDGWQMILPASGNLAVGTYLINGLYTMTGVDSQGNPKFIKNEIGFMRRGHRLDVLSVARESGDAIPAGDTVLKMIASNILLKTWELQDTGSRIPVPICFTFLQMVVAASDICDGCAFGGGEVEANSKSLPLTSRVCKHGMCGVPEAVFGLHSLHEIYDSKNPASSFIQGIPRHAMCEMVLKSGTRAFNGFTIKKDEYGRARVVRSLSEHNLADMSRPALEAAYRYELNIMKEFWQTFGKGEANHNFVKRQSVQDLPVATRELFSRPLRLVAEEQRKLFYARREAAAIARAKDVLVVASQQELPPTPVIPPPQLITVPAPHKQASSTRVYASQLQATLNRGEAFQSRAIPQMTPSVKQPELLETVTSTPYPTTLESVLQNARQNNASIYDGDLWSANVERLMDEMSIGAPPPRQN